MYFIYVFYLKSPPPPVSHPPCTFFNQVLHMWYTVNCLDLRPPHLCTKKTKNCSQFTVQLVPVNTPVHTKVKQNKEFTTTLWQLRSVAQHVPVWVTTDTAGQLDVPWLNCAPLGMDGEKVGIFHHSYQVGL